VRGKACSARERKEQKREMSEHTAKEKRGGKGGEVGGVTHAETRNTLLKKKKGQRV